MNQNICVQGTGYQTAKNSNKPDAEISLANNMTDQSPHMTITEQQLQTVTFDIQTDVASIDDQQLVIGVIGTPSSIMKPNGIFNPEDGAIIGGAYEPRSKKDIAFLKDQLKRNEHLLSSHQSQL